MERHIRGTRFRVLGLFLSAFTLAAADDDDACCFSFGAMLDTEGCFSRGDAARFGGREELGEDDGGILVVNLECVDVAAGMRDEEEARRDGGVVREEDGDLAGGESGSITKPFMYVGVPL